MNPERSRTLWLGVAAGLTGYAVIAILFALENMMAGRSPFHTAALLGGAMFYGAGDLSAVPVGPGPVLAYNGVHLILFLGLGMIAAWLAEFAERGPHLWYVGMTFYFLVAFHLFGAVFVLPAALRDSMIGWGLLANGVAGSLAMALVLVWAHPRLRAEFRDFAAQDPDLADSRS